MNPAKVSTLAPANSSVIPGYGQFQWTGSQINNGAPVGGRRLKKTMRKGGKKSKKSKKSKKTMRKGGKKSRKHRKH